MVSAVPAGIVLFWLLRQEPFTGLARELQGGYFDHADRCAPLRLSPVFGWPQDSSGKHRLFVDCSAVGPALRRGR